MYYIINDVETSGTHSWYHDIVSMAYVVVNEDLSIIDSFSGVCCPWDINHFNLDTVGIHGFSPEYLRYQKSSHDLCIDSLHFLNKYRNKERITYMPFIYHGLNRFDFRFVENWHLKNGLEFSSRKVFNRQHTFSTIKMARQLQYENNSLDVWAMRLGIRLEHHKVLSDTMAAAKLFIYLMKKGITMESGFEIKKSEILDDPSDDKEENKPKEKAKRKYKKTESDESLISSNLNMGTDL